MGSMLNVTAITLVTSTFPTARLDTVVEQWSDGAYVATGAIMTIIGIAATLGNGSVLVMFFINRSLITPTNVLIMALCLSDLLICICGMPLGAASNYYSRWLFGEAGCIWYGFTNLFFGLASLNTLCGISIARYLTVVRQSSDFKFDKKKSMWLAFVAWSWALIWSILPLTGWSRYTLEGARTSCSILWRSDDSKVLSYVVCLFLFGFVLPTAFMTYCYIGIYLATKGAPGRSLLNTTAQRKIYKRQRKVLRLILALTVTYFVSWLPYSIVAVISSVGYQLATESVVVPSMFAKASTVWNPIVYVLLNTRFRKSYMEIMALSLTYFISWTPYSVVAILCTAQQGGVFKYTAYIEIPSTFAKSGVVSNPIVYVLSNPKIRKHYFQMFGISRICKYMYSAKGSGAGQNTTSTLHNQMPNMCTQ